MYTFQLLVINSEPQYFILPWPVTYNLGNHTLTKNSALQKGIVPKRNIWHLVVREAPETHPTQGFGKKFALIGCSLILHPEKDQSQVHNNYYFWGTDLKRTLIQHLTSLALPSRFLNHRHSNCNLITMKLTLMCRTNPYIL